MSVVVENRAGAAGITGSDIVARSAPDGYTVLVTSISHTMFLLQGAEPGTRAQDEFASFVESEIVKWKKVVEFSGARAD